MRKTKVERGKGFFQSLFDTILFVEKTNNRETVRQMRRRKEQENQ